jgi:pyruvate kinase
MALEWGVIPIPIEQASDVEDLWAKSIAAARSEGYVSEGDLIVITAGTAVNRPGTTDVIKVDLA